MTLRILLVSDNYPPYIGGAHRQTQLLGKELQKRGHEVQVVTVWQPGLPEQADDNGVTVHRIKQLRTWLPWFVSDKQQHQPPFPDPISIWGVQRVLESFQPDVIHAYGWFTYALVAAMGSKKIPLLISGRDYAYSCATRTLLYKKRAPCNGPQLRKCLTCASHQYGVVAGWTAVLGVAAGKWQLRNKVTGIHSISTYVQEIIERDFLSQAQSAGSHVNSEGSHSIKAVIPSFRENGIDTVRYSEDPTLQRYVEQLPATPFILFVGALRKVKGVEQLLAAYTRLASPPPLVLIGTYEEDTPQEFPPGVTVLQNFPHRAVLAAWEKALFGVIPSLWPEPLGSVVYEGMSRGRAMIGTKPGGHTDMIIDGKTGLLTPLGDVDALTDAMQFLIDQPAVRERFGAAALEHAERFTAKVNVPRFEQIYRQLIDATSSNTEQHNALAVER
ncbi:MAG: glycosyltransferase family 4 protein [Caldilineaceae bacterium]